MTNSYLTAYFNEAVATAEKRNISFEVHPYGNGHMAKFYDRLSNTLGKGYAETSEGACALALNDLEDTHGKA